MPKKGQTKYNNMFEKGHKFGDWTLIDSQPKRIYRNKSNPKNKYTYKFICECSLCNKQEHVDCYNLEKGITTRCHDCAMKTKEGSNNPAWKGGKIISGEKLYRIKYMAEQRNIHFDITLNMLDESIQKQNYICSLTGLELTKDNWSLDRIDSSKGYTEDNIHWVHKDINMMKNKYSQDYFIEMCKKVSENNTKTN